MSHITEAKNENRSKAQIALEKVRKREQDRELVPLLVSSINHTVIMVRKDLTQDQKDDKISQYRSKYKLAK